MMTALLIVNIVSLCLLWKLFVGCITLLRGVNCLLQRKDTDGP